MPPPDVTHDREEIGRLVDEAEQLRTALGASEEEVARLAEDRDRLLRKLTTQARDLQAANAAYRKSVVAQGESEAAQSIRLAANSEEQEELRVAFEEMQVLTKELEVANASLHETNRALDQRVADRTRELAASNAELTESELRFRTLVEGMRQLVWRAVDGGAWTWASPQWTEYTGLSLADSLGLGWLRALHPEDRQAAEAAWKRADQGTTLELEARIYHAVERRHRHFRIRAAAVPNAEGSPREWVGTSTDVDDLLQLQQRQQLLLAELQHRVRNILSVVRSVFGRTIEGDGSKEDVADHFRGRLDSLGRTQMVVTQNAKGIVDLENLIRDELLSVGEHEGPNLTLEGPEVPLPPRAAESLGLAIHELTTNSVKYGALKIPDAQLKITWEINIYQGGAPRLDLTWTEQGVPAIPLNPTRRGFGSELITEALPYRLGAETSLEFRGGGVRCTISVPLHDEPAPGAAAWRN